MCISCLMFAQLCGIAAAGQESAIEVTVLEEFATFVNRDHPDNRIGYRFHEHTPLIHGAVPEAGSPSSQSEAHAETRIAEFLERPGRTTFRRHVSEEGWIPQDWTFHFAPVSDGIDILLVVETGPAGLPEYYGIQQCFRLSGATNQAWRHKYALAPAFSEFDLWNQAGGDASPISLTCVLQDGNLQVVPARKETVGYRTPSGLAMDEARSGGDIGSMIHVGPYDAEMFGVADSGLILRTSVDEVWSCGIYWERTTHVTDHHPADCLHSIVNIGGIAPHAQRLVRGKIYWMQGSGEELMKHWRRDFPDIE